MDEVVLGVADDRVAVKARRIGVAAIDRNPGAGVDDVMTDARVERIARCKAIRRLERMCRQRSIGLMRKMGTLPPPML